VSELVEFVFEVVSEFLSEIVSEAFSIILSEAIFLVVSEVISEVESDIDEDSLSDDVYHGLLFPESREFPLPDSSLELSSLKDFFH